jgi:Domain of unknown function (DUF4082)/Bacterial Ig-like domain
VSSTAPADGAVDVALDSDATATFDRAMDAASINGGSFTFRRGSGSPLAATVAYDSVTRRAVLDPADPLVPGATYTATLSTDVRDLLGTPLSAPKSWSFTARPASVTDRSPAPNATGVATDTDTTVTFDSAMDAASITSSSFTLSPSGGSPVAASVSYDGGTRTARLDPSAPLQANTTYTARLTTAVRTSDGTPLAADVTWSFTTIAACPCSLFAPTLSPVINNASTRDGRSGTGPWTRELGVKVEVTSPVQLTAVRYYRASSETGAHTARIWTAGGTLLRSVPYTGDAGGGWKQQALAEPLALTPGQVYVISTGFNTYYSATQFGLQTQVVSGPLRSVAVAANGVYSDAAGIFPTLSYRSSNYFVDLVVE